jgi:Transposase
MVSMEEQKKRRTRRKFTDEYKARAVRLVLKEGQTAAQVARDLDLIESVLHSVAEVRTRPETLSVRGRLSKLMCVSFLPAVAFSLIASACLILVTGCGSSPVAESQTDATTSAGQCRHAATVGDGTPGACGAARAYIDCEYPNGAGCGCMTDSTTCSGCGAGATCTDKCGANEYAVSCGGIGPSAPSADPPAACRFAAAIPAGIEYYCCPCL